MSPTFDQLRDSLTDDEAFGQLCDIVMPNASRGEWAAVLRLIASRYRYRFSYGTESEAPPRPIPDDPMDVLVFNDDGPWASLSFELAGLDMRVFINGPDRIEIDCWRTEITPQRAAAIFEFMRTAGDATGLDVFLTPESHLTEAVLVYEPRRGEFREPRRSRGSDGRVRERILAEFAAVLDPVREAALRLPPGALKSTPGAPREPLLPDEVLREAFGRVERLKESYPEIVLQDELTTEERRGVDALWSLLATIVQPPAGSNPREHRRGVERALIMRVTRC